MNYKIISENPIEMHRIKHGLSQKEFAAVLGYPNVANYAYHKDVFNEDIRKRILDKYAVDLTNDIILYLLYKQNAVNPKKTGNPGNVSRKPKIEEETPLLDLIGYHDENE
jgi:hypothetical protein